MKRIHRRIFMAEFKREAIQLVTKKGLTMAEASRKLDIATKSLRIWIEQFECGEFKASLGAYQRCQKMLSTQLSIDPSPKTQALYLAVRDNQPLPA